MVAALMAWLSGRLLRVAPLQSRCIAANDLQSYVGILSAIIYSALAGFSVPTQRTLVMLLVFFGTRLLRRHIGITQGLSIALIGVLLIDPFAPMSPGFWLSFGAVAAIFLATSGRVGRASIATEYLYLQMVVTVGLLPFLIGAFGTVSLISPLVNLLAIPFFTFLLVPIVLMGAFCSIINEQLGRIIVLIAGRLLDWSWPLFEWASHLPLATWHLPQLPIWSAVLLLMGCLIAIAPGSIATRLAAATLCFPALLFQPARPAFGEFQVACLDVGQGLSVVVMTHTHVLVYDTGPSFRTGRNTGQLVVLPYLYSRGVHRIDRLMLTHGDDDHIGGALSVIAGLPTQEVIVGPSVSLTVPTQVCEKGQSWQWDDVSFRVLHPSHGTAERKNNSSCVLRIEGRGGSALLLGDVEREAEAQLHESHAIQHADIVVVPHHGSRTSSTVSLTTASSPKYALVSAGFGNRWGFPKAEVIGRWEEAGAQALKTFDSGAIEIDVTKEGVMAPHLFRVERRAYWR
jgi:competence protein ComEC